MNLTRALQIVGFVYPVSEILLIVVTRARRGGASVHDRGSLALIWGAICAGIFGGIVLQRVPATRIPLPIPWMHGLALALLVAGLVVRWVAILTLGKFFTTAVTVHEDHRIVRTGLYRRVRHPSYSGALLAFLGLALAFGNWLSLIAVLAPIFAAFYYRIRIEESSLVETLGEDYLEYRNSTRYLIPGVF